MDTKPINPLAGHFRRPEIYFKLPSQGRYWGDNSLDLPVTGEIPIFPMTNADEITLKTPDALMNGSAIVNVIQSCCPNITDAWKMPSVDVDATLIAIRIASYGTNMAVTSGCPHCGEEHDYEVNLSTTLENVKCPDFDKTLDYNGLKIKLRPQPYFSITKTNIIQFEEQKIMQTLGESTLDEDVKNMRLKDSMKTLLELNEKLLVDSTEYIETEDGSRVKDPAFIAEYYRNAEGRATKAIEDRMTEIATEGALPPYRMSCASCQQNYEMPLEFDYARFFGQGS
jgi:hypothetical protein